jgi:two-component system, NtrC family, sensor histidine kinase KinB
MTLRTKLTLGFLPLLAILIGLGLWAIVMLSGLGGSIDVILRENYRSVLAVEQMKEALERMDSSFVFAMSGREEKGRTQFDQSKDAFDRHLAFEQSNITLPGEQEMVNELTAEYKAYIQFGHQYFELQGTSASTRSEFYFSRLLPAFAKLKSLEDAILDVNQRNMEQMNEKALRDSSSSRRLMILALLVAVVLAIVSAGVLTRRILGPIDAVTHAARELSEGRLDQVVPAASRDELGELGQAFNTMARTIRAYREAGTVRLLRAQKTAQATIDSFPDPVVVVDLSGTVERANPAAQLLLHAIPPPPGTVLPWEPPAPLKPHLDSVLQGQADYLPLSLDQAIFLRDGSQDRFFLPRVLRIRGDAGEVLGAAIVLSDVTKLQLVDQLKSDTIATVSHELKTPLTSLQMVVHLLLEEAVGPLTPKQVEILIAGRQDSDRLLAMINDLLDLTRIEQGRLTLNLRPVAAADLVAEALVRFRSQAEDVGVALATQSEPSTARVLVDRQRIQHVFDNLIANALRHTPRGGHVTLGAAVDNDAVRFSVEDTGEGIPQDYLPRIFDRFFRLPGAPASTGAGLGLAIAREIVIGHGGQIDVRSEVGKGTTLVFRLPMEAERRDDNAGTRAPGVSMETREKPRP